MLCLLFSVVSTYKTTLSGLATLVVPIACNTGYTSACNTNGSAYKGTVQALILGGFGVRSNPLLSLELCWPCSGFVILYTHVPTYCWKRNEFPGYLQYIIASSRTQPVKLAKLAAYMLV